MPQGTWVEHDANNAVTETPDRLALAREAGDESIVLLKNATSTPQGRHAGKLLPLAVPSPGAYKVARARLPTPNPRRVPGRLLERPGRRRRRRTRSTATTGIKNAIQAINPDAHGRLLARLHRHGHERGNCCTTIDPAAVAAAAGYDAVIVYAGTDASAPRPRTATARRSRCRARRPS